MKTKTLRDLRTYCETNPNNYWADFFIQKDKDGNYIGDLPKPYDFLNSLLDIRFHYCEACDFKYAVEYEMTDHGILMIHTYLWKEVEELEKKRSLWIRRNYDRTLSQIENINRCLAATGDIKEQWQCEVLLTRGYSDTPKRTDTELSSLDIDIATREAIEQHEGVHRLQEWELRSALSASGIIDDLHMEETEVDDLIAAVI